VHLLLVLVLEGEESMYMQSIRSCHMEMAWAIRWNLLVDEFGSFCSIIFSFSLSLSVVSFKHRRMD